MPQFVVKIKNLDNRLTEKVTVWASNKRAANHEAIKIAQRLLGTKNLDIID